MFADMLFADSLFVGGEYITDTKSGLVLTWKGNLHDAEVFFDIPYDTFTDACRRQVFFADPIAGSNEIERHVHFERIHKKCPKWILDKYGTVQILKRGQFGNSIFYFKRKMKEYEDGFGIEDKEYWIGLKTLHNLTSASCPWQLKITLWDQNDKAFHVLYDRFYVGPPPHYKLSVDGYFSPGENLRDRLENVLHYHTNMSFTTIDRDQDQWGVKGTGSDNNCAEHYGGGGWWYKSCAEGQLTGANFNTNWTNWEDNFKGIFWGTFTMQHPGRNSFKAALMTMTLHTFS